MPKKNASALNGRTIRCILFDCGDTLWTRSDQHIWSNLEHVANQQALAFLRTLVSPSSLPVLEDTTLGEEIRRAVERQIRHRKREDTEHEPDFPLATLQGLQHIGILGLDRAAGEAIFEALRVRIPESRPLFQDTHTTLTALQQRGYTLGVVTNRHWGGQIFLEDMQQLGLDAHFDLQHIAVSADLGLRKPHPGIFLHALNRLGFAPEEAAMVGDSLSADIAGAKPLNLFTIWKPKTILFAEAKATLPSPEDDIDEYVFRYALQRESKRKQERMQNKDIQPDLIIESLSDLLDVFVEAPQE